MFHCLRGVTWLKQGSLNRSHKDPPKTQPKSAASNQLTAVPPCYQSGLLVMGLLQRGSRGCLNAYTCKWPTRVMDLQVDKIYEIDKIYKNIQNTQNIQNMNYGNLIYNKIECWFFERLDFFVQKEIGDFKCILAFLVCFVL